MSERVRENYTVAGMGGTVTGCSVIPLFSELNNRRDLVGLPLIADKKVFKESDRK